MDIEHNVISSIMALGQGHFWPKVDIVLYNSEVATWQMNARSVLYSSHPTVLATTHHTSYSV